MAISMSTLLAGLKKGYWSQGFGPKSRIELHNMGDDYLLSVTKAMKTSLKCNDGEELKLRQRIFLILSAEVKRRGLEISNGAAENKPQG